MRTVKFELNDPDALEVARDALSRQVAAVLEEEELETPISQAVGQQLALESGDPQQVEIAELATAVQALTAEVRGRSQPRFSTFISTQDPQPSSVEVVGNREAFKVLNLGGATPSSSVRIADFGEFEGPSNSEKQSETPKTRKREKGKKTD